MMNKTPDIIVDYKEAWIFDDDDLISINHLTVIGSKNARIAITKNGNFLQIEAIDRDPSEMIKI